MFQEIDLKVEIICKKKKKMGFCFIIEEFSQIYDSHGTQPFFG